MIRIPDSKFVYAIGRHEEPAACCVPGKDVLFETKDCFSNQIGRETDLFESVGWATINPATGPLYVEGAVPGDTLKVTIKDIKVKSPGVMIAVPALGALGHLIDKSVTRIVPIDNDTAMVSPHLSVPLDPMIGVIGTAPAGEPVPCGTPGPHGGNMDTRHIRKGAKVYLPVAVEGALLCMGDLHAAMGDGEVVVCGVEAAGEVTVGIELLKSVSLPCPVVQDSSDMYFIHSAEDLDAASQGAIEAALYHITSRTRLDTAEAGMILSVAGHVEISQVVDPLKTARFRLPVWVADKLGVKLP